MDKQMEWEGRKREEKGGINKFCGKKEGGNCKLSGPCPSPHTLSWREE